MYGHIFQCNSLKNWAISGRLWSSAGTSLNLSESVHIEIEIWVTFENFENKSVKFHLYVWYYSFLKKAFQKPAKYLKIYFEPKNKQGEMVSSFEKFYDQREYLVFEGRTIKPTAFITQHKCLFRMKLAQVSTCPNCPCCFAFFSHFFLSFIAIPSFKRLVNILC